MKKILKFRLVLACMFMAFNGIAQTETLYWSDEFNGKGAPDTTFWSHELGSHGWGNNEIQNYTANPENSRQEGGVLIIEAHKNNNEWTSARLVSRGKFNFTYGRIEFRAKLPAGSGTWPALWMLGENIATVDWPACGEIDVMEHVGKNPGVAQAALHTTHSHGNTINKQEIAVPDFNTAFHTYEASWTKDKIDFLVDGKIYYSFSPEEKNDETWPFNKPFFIIMNIAMGGNWGSDVTLESGGLKNGIEPSLTKARMEVDYVRVYKTNP